MSYSKSLRWGLDQYLAYRFKKSFEQVILSFDSLSPSDQEEPLVLVANHCSWWDGFLLAELQKQIRPGRAFYTIMLESELRQRPFFRKIGAIGIDPRNSASVARAFLDLRQICQADDHGPVIAFFPQGRIQPQRCRPLNFKPGIELLTKVLRPAQVLPVALSIEPLRAPKPTAFVKTGSLWRADDQTPISAKNLESQIEALLAHQDTEIAAKFLNEIAQ